MKILVLAIAPLLVLLILYLYLIGYLGKASVHAGLLLCWKGEDS